MREVFDFNKDWLFCKGEFSETDMYAVDLPHDYALDDGVHPDFLQGGAQAYANRWDVGYYKKIFTLSALKNKVVYLFFDGVMRNSEVYINGEYAGGRPYGYAPFQLDITRFVKEGENTLFVKVDNSKAPADRWYTGAGIYRDVKLVLVNKEHILPYGVCVTYDRDCNVTVKTEQIGGEAVCAELFYEGKRILSEEGGDELHFTVPRPHLWSPEDPELYELRVSLLKGGVAVDRVRETIGFRHIEMSGSGMFLNGQPVKLKGGNLHHDGGMVGAAVPDFLWEYRLKKVKQIGCNAIRCSHNPPSKNFLDLCDRLGFLVIDEAFDKWEWEKGFYIEIFRDWWKRDLEAMLRRDRNHPCVFLWSVGNEVEVQGGEEFFRKLKMLVSFTREYEPTRPVTVALHPGLNVPVDKDHVDEMSMEEKFSIVERVGKIVDVLCCNYQEQWYEEYHRRMPEMPVIGSETYTYFTGKLDQMIYYEDKNPYEYVKENDYVIGQFTWPLIDYLGENGAYPHNSFGSGLFDLNGEEKISAAFYRAQWGNVPCVHVSVFDNNIVMPSSHNYWGWVNVTDSWNDPAKMNVVRLQIYTNCKEVRLYTKLDNNPCFMEMRFTQKDAKYGIIEHFYPYNRGELVAEGWDGEKVVCRHSLVTAGEKYRLRLNTVAQDDEYALVKCEVTDKNGIVVPYSDDLITFSADGGRVLRTASADNYDPVSFLSNSRNAFMGVCFALVKKQGRTFVRATADRLVRDRIRLD